MWLSKWHVILLYSPFICTLTLRSRQVLLFSISIAIFKQNIRDLLENSITLTNETDFVRGWGWRLITNSFFYIFCRKYQCLSNLNCFILRGLWVVRYSVTKIFSFSKPHWTFEITLEVYYHPDPLKDKRGLHRNWWIC